jgi:hypothetical protein
MQSGVPQVGGFYLEPPQNYIAGRVRVRTTSYSTGTGLCLELTRADVRHAKRHSPLSGF